MKAPDTKSTREGTFHALAWVEGHAGVLPQLRKLLQEYARASERDFPWRHSTDPYQVLLAEVLLQRTAARSVVVGVWHDLIRRYPDASALAAAPLEEIEAAIRPLGLTKRAKALQQLARTVVRETGGRIVADAAFLESLPGLGSYGANAVLSFAYNIKAAVVDANAVRVYSRIGGFSPITRRQGLAYATVIADLVVTQDSHREVNYGLLDFAARICKPRPLCHKCPALPLCQYGRERGFALSHSRVEDEVLPQAQVGRTPDPKD